MSSLLLVAGEASGDLHGARLLSELRTLIPDLTAFGLGGDELAAAGLDAVAHSSEVAVVGIVEVLKVLPRARRVFADLLSEVDRRRPQAAVLVDFPEFNLRLAKELKDRGVPVVYYVSPQVWAWRRGRVHQIARRVDRMLVLFPFEAGFYRDAGVEVIHVGHPLVDEVPQLPHVWEKGPPDRFRLALLPGSRPSEVEALLPTMLRAAARIAASLDVSILVQRAPSVPASMVEEAVAASGLEVEVASSERFERLAASHLALCASGTATLEVGLLGTPLIVLYRLRLWTYLLGLLLVRLPHISLVNLVLEREVVPELLQRHARPQRVAAEACSLLTDPERVAAMRRGLADLRPRLGEGGASRRAAEQVASLLGGGEDAEVPA